MKAKRIMIAALISVLTVFICMPQMVAFGWDPDPTDPNPTDPDQCMLSVKKGEHIENAGIKTDPQSAVLVPSVTVPKDSQAEISAVPKSGYHFTGYDYFGVRPEMDFTKADQTITVKGDVTLTAKAEANKYTVRYDANGGEGTMDDQSMTYDVEAELSSNNFVRAHYYFNGWNTDKDGKGTAYKNKDKVRNLSAKQDDTVMMYAQWTEKPVYKVTYDLNGGKMKSKTGKVSYKYEEGQIITIPKPAKKGYKFKYWVGEDEEQFEAGEKIEVESNMDLTASWKSTSSDSKKNSSKTKSDSSKNSDKDKTSKTGENRHQTIPVLLMLISVMVMAITAMGIKKSR